MGSIEQELQLTPEQDEEACTYALLLSAGCLLPMTLKLAIELHLLDIIVRTGPGARLSPADIAALLPARNPQAAVAVDRILRLLAAHNIVSCSFDAGGDASRPSLRYGAAPVCKYLTKNEDGGSVAPCALMFQDKVLMESWYYSKDAVLEGGVPFEKAYGMTMFEYSGTDERFNKVFNESMGGLVAISIRKLVDIYGGFDDIKVLVDVGGGTGATLHLITSKHPHIRGVNFDLPHVIADAPPISGVEHVSGDMFESVPIGDAILLKAVLHNWSDEHCAKLLKNCWKALPEKGKLIVVEAVLPAVPEPKLRSQYSCISDLAMFAYIPGGIERTEGEFQDLAKEAGFSGFKSTYVFTGLWVIELTK